MNYNNWFYPFVLFLSVPIYLTVVGLDGQSVSEVGKGMIFNSIIYGILFSGVNLMGFNK